MDDWYSEMEAKADALVQLETPKAMEALRNFFEQNPKIYIEFKGAIERKVTDDQTRASVDSPEQKMSAFLGLGRSSMPSKEADYWMLLSGIMAIKSLAHIANPFPARNAENMAHDVEDKNAAIAFISLVQKYPWLILKNATNKLAEAIIEKNQGWSLSNHKAKV